LEPLKKIEQRVYQRIGIISAILLVFGLIVFPLILVRQNYDLLERQYQVVESYSSDIIHHVSDSIIVWMVRKE